MPDHVFVEGLSIQPQFEKDRQRFAIAGITSLANIANAGIWSAYASVTTTSAVYYDTNSFGINLLSLIFMFIYIPVSPLSSWVLDTRGIRTSV